MTTVPTSASVGNFTVRAAQCHNDPGGALGKVVTLHGTPATGYDLARVHAGEVIRSLHVCSHPTAVWVQVLRNQGYIVQDLSS